MMKLERLHITVFVIIAFVVWAFVLLFQGTSFGWDHIRPFTIVISVLVAIGWLLEHQLWNQAWMHGWFVKRPDLRGTWRVELQSSYKNPDTGQQVPQIVCYMGVEQTLSTIQMHLMTPESESWFIADQIRVSPNGTGYQIIGVYTNEPQIHLRHERISEMHQGAIIIETHGGGVRPASLTAKYWTDRKTTGVMEFVDRSEQVYTRFKDAHQAYSE